MTLDNKRFVYSGSDRLSSHEQMDLIKNFGISLRDKFVIVSMTKEEWRTFQEGGK